MAFLLVIVVVLLGTLWLLGEKNLFKPFEKFDFKTWFLIIAQSFLLSISAGLFVWRWSDRYPQEYTDFISGNLAFTSQLKTPEYYGLYTAIFSFVLLFVAFGILYRFINELEEASKSAILRLGLYALIPTSVLIGQSLRIENTSYLLVVSGLGIVLSLLTAVSLSVLLMKKVIQPQDTWNIAVKWIMGMIFLVMSVFGYSILLSRLGIFNFNVTMTTLAAMAGILTLSLISWRFRLVSFQLGLKIFFTLSQIGIPLIFLVFYPPPSVANGGIQTGLQLKPALYIFIGLLLLIAYVDLARRFTIVNKINVPLNRWFSPWIVFAVLVFIKSYRMAWPALSADNYHVGEFYLPFWQSIRFGYLPFTDYQPARGLINYLPGFLSWLFSDGSFSAQALLLLHTDAFYLLIGFFGLRVLSGDLGAFLSIASIFLFQGNMTGGLVIAIACLSVICKVALNHSAVLALWVWLVLSLGTILFVVAEGAVFVLGTLPLAVYLLCKAYHQERKALYRSGAILGSGIGILLLTTRAGEILLSITRYLLEQSAINDIAHGMAWSYPEAADLRVTAGYLWQFIRFSWLLLIIPIVLELVRTKQLLSSGSISRIRWFWLVTIFIMVILIIPRANGRIDTDALSRPGLVSIGIVMSALPYLILGRINNPLKRAGAILGIALVFGLLGDQENNLRSAWLVNKAPLIKPAAAASGADLGLSNVGKLAVASTDHIKRQQSIRKVLDTLLQPEETYFDATNNSADYGYQDRRCPVVECAPYNTPAESQQVRMIQQLENQQIPLVLLSSDNRNHDGGPLSLRDYWLYRYLLNTYTPFIDSSDNIWMIRNGQESRLAGTPFRIEPDKKIAYLSSVFWQENLDRLPISWGASTDQLISKLENPTDLLTDPPLEMHGIKKLDSGLLEVVEEAAYLVIQVPVGSKGDMLYLETDRPVQSQTLEIAWSNDLVPAFNDSSRFVFHAKASRYLVPLSSAPSWTLGQLNRKIRIYFTASMKGQVTIDKIVLYNRLSK